MQAWPPAPRRRRPWLAAALSLLCGLGQLYNGQTRKGLVLIMLGTAALMSLQWPIGHVLLPLVWLYAIVDAYLVARQTVVPTPSHTPPIPRRN
jgi:TM2 domain-containing membrane protein YozV